MNRFSAATFVNVTADAPPSYKAALLDVLRQSSSGGAPSSSSLSPDSNWPPPPPSILDGGAMGNEAEMADSSIKGVDSQVKSKEFGNGGGEIDMLIGFFFMNGACIFFFLMFGMCVICNCMRRRPKFHTAENGNGGGEPPKSIRSMNLFGRSTTPKASTTATKSESFVASPPIVSPTLKPTFKAFINKALQQQKAAEAAAATAAAGQPGKCAESSLTMERSRTEDSFAANLSRRLSALSGGDFDTNHVGAAVPTSPSIEEDVNEGRRRSSGGTRIPLIPSVMLRRCSNAQPPKKEIVMNEESTRQQDDAYDNDVVIFL